MVTTANHLRLLLALLLLAAAGCEAGNTGPGGCTSYLGDLHGAPGTARIQLSRSVHFNADSNSVDGTYVQMGGEIVSDTARYTFAAEIYGASGYGDMVDLLSGERFRIKIDFAERGFYLTTNPFEGAFTTTYSFACQ